MFSGKNLIKSNKRFAIYILSQAVSAVGDSFQFIATTSLLMKITGSGIFAGFSIIFTTSSSIFFLPIAVIIGDKFQEKYFLIIIDILRGILVLFFINEYNNFLIFILLLVLSALDALYNPPRRKMIANILKSNEILEGNSLLIGVTGLVFIIGSVIAGILVNQVDSDFAFVIRSLSFFISAMILISLKVSNVKYRYKSKGKQGIDEALRYLKMSMDIRKLVIIGTLITFCTALANIAFYTFVFDALYVTSKEWGIMVSLFYGTNLLGMLFASYYGKITDELFHLGLFVSLIVVSVTWILYGITTNLVVVIFLQVIEGTASCFTGIVLISYLQRITGNHIMARIISINDIMNNAGKILGVSLGFVLLNYCNYRVIFILNGILMFFFALYEWVLKKRLAVEN